MITKRRVATVTHQQIADHLGVSRQLVTHALHGTRSSRISPQTQTTIQHAARQLGYRPRNVTTHTVGYVMSSAVWHSEAVTRYMSLLEGALRERGYRLVPITIKEEALHELPDQLNAKLVDGVLLDQWYEQLPEYLPSDVPYIVCAEQDQVPLESDVVTIDFEKTLLNVLRHLRGFGHHHICFVTSHHKVGFYRRLRASAKKAAAALSDNALTLQLLECDEDAGVLDAAIQRILDEPGAPTALITADLWRSVPTLFALREAGYRVPEDISLVSLLDSRMLKNLRPYLTATTAGGATTAEKTVARLVEKIHNPLSPARHEKIAGEVISRASCAPPAQ